MRPILFIVALLSLASCSSFGSALQSSTPWGNAGQFWVSSVKPSTGAQALVTRAATVGVRRALGCLSATIAATGTAQDPIGVQLTVGSTTYDIGSVSVPANNANGFFTCDLRVTTAKNEALTLKFSGTGAAATQQTVMMSTYDLP